MKWKFIKTNWFSIVLVLMVLVFIARKNLHVHTGGSASPDRKESTPEKYTAAGGKSMLDILPGSSGVRSDRPSLDKAAAVAFVRRFEKVAVSERKKFGIPSSVLLACAYVNSYAGQRSGLEQTNNYFALPCTSDWEGETATADGHCVRKYASAWESFRDFSIYLTSQEWYGSVKKSAGKDWQAWVREIADKGIFEVPNVKNELEKAIEAHRLYDLDDM